MADLNFFEVQNQTLIFRENGETVMVTPWGRALQISFYNQKGELLLQEIPNGGALQKKARHFRPLPGGGYELKASFCANPGEKLYGMGQYQQEVMDLKGCNLELAHRNSQASIPFYVSSLGSRIWASGPSGWMRRNRSLQPMTMTCNVLPPNLTF